MAESLGDFRYQQQSIRDRSLLSFSRIFRDDPN
jgi:hypothetical protein